MGTLNGSPADGSAGAAPDLPADPASAVPGAERGRGHRRRTGHARRSGAASAIANTGIGIATALVVVAPLAAGAVHRATMIAVMAAAVASIALLSGGLALQGRSLRVGAVVLIPIGFMLIPLLQSI